MKHTYLHIFATAVAALTLSACDKDDIEPDAGNVAPSFTATIEGGHSRTIGCDWEIGDEIGISTSVSPLTSNEYNACYTAQTTDGEFAEKELGDKLYYKSTSRTANVTFNAYYPYRFISDPTVSNNRLLEFNTSDQSNRESYDFLWASSKGSKESPDVVFSFNHKMSMVTFVFRNGDGFDVSAIDSCSLGELYMNGKFNITSGAISSLSNMSTAGLNLSDAEVKDNELEANFILAPQSAPKQPIKLEIVSNTNQIFSVDLTFPKLDAGKNYQFTVTVNNTGMVINNSTIENWINKDDTGWGAGTADSADDPEENL